MNYSKENNTKEYFISEFHKHFDGTPRIFRAPARINLIGGHTDYNEGFVLPVLLERYTTVAIAPRDDNELHIWSENMNELLTFSMDNLKPRGIWSDYIVGVVKELIEENFLFSGANVCIMSEIPIGGGLSSSAAVEVAIANGILSLVGDSMDKCDIARVCQRAENKFVGMQSGIMDQFVIIHGKEKHALFLDCRSLEFEHIPLLTNNIRIVVCNTKIKHELAASAYNERKAECQEGVRLFKGICPGINALRDVSLRRLTELKNTLPEVIRKRCYHVVSENERVIKSVKALKQNQYAVLGQLINESHDSLRDYYEVSCHELNTMVDIARSLPGVLGSRLTGGGFGGCTVNLVESEHVDNFIREISSRYEEKTGLQPEIYISEPVGGAYELV